MTLTYKERSILDVHEMEHAEFRFHKTDKNVLLVHIVKKYPYEKVRVEQMHLVPYDDVVPIEDFYSSANKCFDKAGVLILEDFQDTSWYIDPLEYHKKYKRHYYCRVSETRVSTKEKIFDY